MEIYGCKLARGDFCFAKFFLLKLDALVMNFASFSIKEGIVRHHLDVASRAILKWLRIRRAVKKRSVYADAPMPARVFHSERLIPRMSWIGFP